MKTEMQNHPELDLLAPAPCKVRGRETLDEQFSKWVRNPLGSEIANRFIRASCGLKTAGWKRYGAKRIIEGIRWNIHLENGPAKDGEFKVNNNMTSRLARFAETKCSDLNGFFEKRELKGRSP